MYKRKQEIIQAIQLTQDIAYGENDPNRNQYPTVIAKKGDWLVTEGNQQFFLSDKEFRKQFEVVITSKPLTPYGQGIRDIGGTWPGWIDTKELNSYNVGDFPQPPITYCRTQENPGT